MLMGLVRSKDEDEDSGFTGYLALVQRFGDLCPDLLASCLRVLLEFTLCCNSAEE